MGTFLVLYSILILAIELLAYFLYTLLGGKRKIHYAIFLIPIIAFVFFEVKWKYNKKDELLRTEKRRVDSLRNVFIKDSLFHDPRYQDSLRHAKYIRKEYERKTEYYEAREIVGYVYENDTIYHNNFHWIHEIPDEYLMIWTNYLIDDIGGLRFVTRHQVEYYKLTECSICEEMNQIYCDYENGDLIHVEDAREYVEENY